MRDVAGNALETVVRGATTLHVSVEGGFNTPAERYLRAPRAEGMASEPVTVSLDREARCWMIRNSGRTNTLRVQQYGLAAVPLRPRAAMPMSGEDVAVWIPFVPREPWVNDKREAFRLLILAAKELPRLEPPKDSGAGTRLITAPRRQLTPERQEAIIAYFGDQLSWPPLPAPHVRQDSEVEEIAIAYRLRKEPTIQHWVRNRHEVLAGKEGLFNAADWYPKLGGPDRSLPNHLAAFYRLVELRSITLMRVRSWAVQHKVEPYIIIDPQVGLAR
jgi:hypothetical protein